MNAEITCSICGQTTAREVRRTKILGKGEHQVIVENVPMISCRNCGHDYFSIQVAKMLDQIRSTPQKQAMQKSFAVVELAA
ncbi:MAG: YgiT-type zinc finger protein [Blastocatellia bacterium]|nr:YgiT-type zinc finger protein [Blastocatellia bacterium]